MASLMPRARGGRGRICCRASSARSCGSTGTRSAACCAAAMCRRRRRRSCGACCSPAVFRPRRAPQSRRAPALSSAFAAVLHQLEAPVPSDLGAHILARTTRAPRDARSMISAPVALSPSVSIERRFGFRLFSLLGAPALALLLLIVGRSNFNQIASPNVAATCPKRDARPRRLEQTSCPRRCWRPTRAAIELAPARPELIGAALPARAETVAARRVLVAAPGAALRAQAALVNDAARARWPGFEPG